jgi:D-alanine-D-alanine ligase
MHVGFIYNIATPELLRERPEMTVRDSDSQDTIDAIRAALEAGGHTVTCMNADADLPVKLRQTPLDIVFNIATGVWGETRQSHVPAMLEYLRIPHTGSGVVGEALCHHKHLQKIVFAAHGLPTAPFQMFATADDPLDPKLRFPLIVKLSSEGASMGIDYNAVVQDEAALRERVRLMLEVYESRVMAEEYIDGREFTVAVIGNDPPRALPIGELQFYGKLPIRLDQLEDEHYEMLKDVTGRDLELVEMESYTQIPAEIPPELAARISQLAVDAFRVLECQDWGRVDLRMDHAGNLYLLEMNLEPGIAPDYAFTRCGEAAGMDYVTFVNTILQIAASRYPHLSGHAPAVNERARQYLGSLARDKAAD